MTMRLRSLFLATLAVFLSGCAITDFGPRSNARGPASVVVDLSAQRAYLYKGRTVVLETAASTGREGFDTPTGKFRVVQKEADHRSTLYGAYVMNGRVVAANVDTRKTTRPSGATFEGAPMPYFIRIVGAVGMHAGHVPGYPASHGCIRLPKWKARRFFDAVRIGTPVTIRS